MKKLANFLLGKRFFAIFLPAVAFLSAGFFLLNHFLPINSASGDSGVTTSLLCQTDQKLMSVKLFNGTVYAGGYNLHSAKLYTCSGGSSSVQKTFSAESVFGLEEFNGSLYASHEHGDFSDSDKATVYRLEGSNWVRKYKDSNRNLGMELKKSGISLYFSSVHYEGGNGSAVFKTTDGANWSQAFTVSIGCSTEYLADFNGTIYAGSHCGGFSDMKPALWRGSGERVNTPYDSESGTQFSGMTSFSSNLYLGMNKNCRIVKYNGSSFQTVYTCESGHTKLTWMGATNDNVYALVQMPWDAHSGDSHLLRSSDGSNWSVVATFPMPEAVWADIASDGTIYVAGGEHDKYGRVYKVTIG